MSVATDPTQIAAPTRRRDRRRKVRAVLAAGLVLGIGGAVTLAAWNDSEFASGTFTAGTFNMEGSTTSATTGFTDHATSTTGVPAVLPFTLPAANLSPGSVVYAPFAVRLAAGTTTGASVALQTPVLTSGAAVGLTYSLIQPTAFGCTSSTTGTTLVAAGSAMNAGTATFTLAQGANAATAGAAVNLCFVVTAGPTLPQTVSSTVTWQFLATST